MKKINIFLFLSTVFVLNSFSQNYIAKYQNFTSEECDSVLLIFNASEWFYISYYTPAAKELNIVQNGVEISADNFDEIPENLRKTKYPPYNLFTYHNLKENEYLKQSGYIIKAPMNRLDWTISADSSKFLGNYQCLMATADLCGVPVTAWFAPEIPVTCGPDRFWGLPGLIVSVKTADGSVFLELLSLSKTENKIVKPQVANTVTKEQFWKMKKEFEAKLARLCSSMNNENMTITISSSPTTDRDKCLLE